MTIDIENAIPSIQTDRLYGTFSADGWQYDQSGYSYDQSGLMYDQIGGRVGIPPQIFFDQSNPVPHFQNIEDIRP